MTDKKQSFKLSECRAKLSIEERSLITQTQALDLVALFKVLGNDTRLRILHVLILGGEICVGEIADKVEMKPQAVSNQLQRLVDKGIVSYRRNGNQIYYRITDPCVINLMDRGLCLAEDSMERIR